MVERGNRRARNRDPVYVQGDWKHFLAFGSLVVAAAGTLILGAWLQADGEWRSSSSPPPPRAASPAESPAPPPASAAPPPAGATPTPTPTPPEVAEPPLAAGPALDDLAGRADADRRRLAADGDGWTLQFMLACDPANVRPRLTALADDPDFYLLPALYDGRACFRLCWGRFPSREQAAGHRDFPGPLAAVTGRPRPLPVEQALR